MSDRAPGARHVERVLLTKREAADFCGLACSTFDRYRAAGWVPKPVKIGNVIRWKLDDLRAWLEAGCPKG